VTGPPTKVDPTGADPAMLSDVRVLDLGDEATALAGELLAELGAEVIRVEDQRGDELRARGPAVAAVHHAGKRSIAIDTTTDAGWEPVRGLLGTVDVIIGPLAAGPATRRFIEHAAGLPQPGPGIVDVVFRRSQDPEPVTDLTLTAAGGLIQLCGETGDPPNHPAGDLGWKQTSLAAAEAAMALITARSRLGRSGRIELSAQEAVILTTLQTANGNIHHWHGRVPDRHNKPAAFTTVASADGRWTSFTIHPPNWPRFVEWATEVLGPTGLDGPQWLDLDYVAANRHLVAEVVSQLAAATEQADLIERGQRLGLLVLPLNDVDGVIADRHLAARDFWVDVDTPSGPVRLAGSPFRSSLGRAWRRPVPELGADNHLLDRPPTDGGDSSTTATVTPLLPVTATDPGSPPLPLAGVRIADFCWAIAGPLSTRLLADLGADVIKIESDNRLDPIRYIGPQPPDGGSIDTNGVFNDCSANKRAVTINVDTEAGRELVRRLIATADVVTANYTPDRLDRWGLGWESVQRLRPGLIVANLAVMGTWGPDAGWRSYGSGLVAMCGLAAHTGFDGTVPECLGTLHTDFTVPYFAALQILAALHHRDRTGEGSYLELSQYESAVRLLDVELAEVLDGGPNPGRRANRSPHHHPHGVYPAAGDDRWVAIASRNDDERSRLAVVLDCSVDDLSPDRPAESVDATIAAWTKARSRQDIVAALRRAGVPVSAVEDLADHRAGTHSSAAWAELDLPAGVSARVLHEPITWDGERLPIRPAPMWFEHTYEVVVDELGVEPDEFAALLDAGALS